MHKLDTKPRNDQLLLNRSCLALNTKSTIICIFIIRLHFVSRIKFSNPSKTQKWKVSCFKAKEKQYQKIVSNFCAGMKNTMTYFKIDFCHLIIFLSRLKDFFFCNWITIILVLGKLSLFFKFIFLQKGSSLHFTFDYQAQELYKMQLIKTFILFIRFFF